MARSLALVCLFVGLIALSSALTDYQEDMLEAYYRAQLFRQFTAQRQGNRAGQPRVGGRPGQPGAQPGFPGAQGFNRFNNPFFPLHPYYFFNDK